VSVEAEGQMPIWSLYQGEGEQSRLIWTQTFKDPDLLNDVIGLSLPHETKTDIFSGRPESEREAPAPDPAIANIRNPLDRESHEIEL
ncbi:hypothetical protein ABTJ37_21850, partial [Acinetobacter baumannii]